MKSLGVRTAKKRLSAMLDEVERGASFMITRYGRPVALLVPAQAGAHSMSVTDAIVGLRAFRRGRFLGFSSRTLIEEGRRPS